MLTGMWRDIVSYKETGCPRAYLYWSNPLILYKGEPIGDRCLALPKKPGTSSGARLAQRHAVAHLQPGNPVHALVTEHSHQQNCWTKEDEMLEMS